MLIMKGRIISIFLIYFIYLTYPNAEGAAMRTNLLPNAGTGLILSSGCIWGAGLINND